MNTGYYSEGVVLHSRKAATVYVIAALESKGTATRDDFDIPGIVAATREIAGSWNFQSVDSAVFWETAARHLKQ